MYLSDMFNCGAPGMACGEFQTCVEVECVGENVSN